MNPVLIGPGRVGADRPGGLASRAGEPTSSTTIIKD
jgi:hypothetical protein